ncbi:hypothetical protein TNIN_16081 [Trichonephila inaurata madagascariensis]|uniref:Uncharacterized protein n=1 Tax=Trichonephila inaurata madagascariensis TaxID=2747483 RepID=A0A8X6IKQ5_9ARAC|nr:hypothetical protein TNIN_16081 [Trichonephila inaurata madagascariensis]
MLRYNYGKIIPKGFAHESAIQNYLKEDAGEKELEPFSPLSPRDRKERTQCQILQNPILFHKDEKFQPWGFFSAQSLQVVSVGRTVLREMQSMESRTEKK